MHTFGIGNFAYVKETNHFMIGVFLVCGFKEEDFLRFHCLLYWEKYKPSHKTHVSRDQIFLQESDRGSPKEHTYEIWLKTIH